jgi:hypothetical protein
MDGEFVIAGNRRGELGTDVKNEGNTVTQSKCKFLVTETVLARVYENCQNPKMLAINKCESGKPLHCMGERCGNASFD